MGRGTSGKVLTFVDIKNIRESMDIKWEPLKPQESLLTITVDAKVCEELATGKPETVVAFQDTSGRILGYFTGCFIPAGSVEVGTPTAEQLDALNLNDKSLESGGRSLREIMNELERQQPRD